VTGGEKQFMTCPYRHDLSLPDMPASIAKLPVDERGYPIPFFVDYLPDGKPEFRAADPAKLVRCIREAVCWVCGEKLHRSRLGFKSTIAFAIGPMCAVNRISSEPPSHPDCAEWSARNCPFLARPHAKRREDEVFNAKTAGDQRGIPILRNPGVILVWYTDGYSVEPTPKGPLFKVKPLTAPATWWAEGRRATRAEIMHSIDTGMPLLIGAAEMEPTPERRALAIVEINKSLDRALKLVPAE
jgi:hypothetical protein